MAPEGGESPPPESQTDAQLHDATGSGTATSKDQADKDWERQGGHKGTEGLTSNPKGPLEDAVKEKFGKTKN